MSRCTWVGCVKEATQPQVAQDTSVWANLCGDHHRELVRAVTDARPQVLLPAWIKAQGGAKVAAQRLLDGG